MKIEDKEMCVNFTDTNGSEVCKAAGVPVSCGGFKESCHFQDLFKAIQSERSASITAKGRGPKFIGGQFGDDPKQAFGAAFMPDRITQIRERRAAKGIV